MTYESTRGTFQSTVVTCTHPTMHLRTARSEIELKFEIRSMLEKSFQDRYTDILKQFLVTQVQKEYITEQWAGKTNQLRALLLRSTADILEMHEDFENQEENGIFGCSWFSIADNSMNNLKTFHDRVWDMVLRPKFKGGVRRRVGKRFPGKSVR